MKDSLSALWGRSPVTTKATVAQSPPPDPQPAPPPEAPAAVAEAYTPWGREHADTTDIEIRCKNGEWAQMREPFITGVEGVGDAILTLKATSGAITLEGRNLGELRRLIRHRKVDFIQEFDAGKWRMPTANMPVVERVTIHQTRVAQLVPKGQGPSR